MNITIDFNKDDANLLLAQLMTNRDWLIGELDRVKGNIKEIEDALNPSGIKETMVVSQTDSSKMYLIRYDTRAESYLFGTPDGSGYGYSCTCLSFVFGSGVDSFGWCKHIRRVIDEGRFMR